MINPLHAIQEGWITFPEWMTEEQKQKCIQPNAIDFTLDRLFTCDMSKSSLITEKERKLVSPDEVVNTDSVLLANGSLYDMMSDFYVNLPENVAAMLIVRSSFNRAGVQLTSGLYDAGFSGHIGAVLYNRGASVYTEFGTRVGQIMFMEAASASLYDGIYNSAAGVHWSANTQQK